MLFFDVVILFQYLYYNVISVADVLLTAIIPLLLPIKNMHLRYGCKSSIIAIDKICYCMIIVACNINYKVWRGSNQ